MLIFWWHRALKRGVTVYFAALLRSSLRLSTLRRTYQLLLQVVSPMVAVSRLP
jgi:hypothetical protein